MKKRKRFSEHPKEQSIVINESQLLSKAYAVGQSANHNSTSTAINSKAAKLATLSRDAIIADNIEIKINKIADALIQFSEILKLQSNQSTAIKNVLVASALFHVTCHPQHCFQIKL
jgi:hypothetical protein